MTEPKYAICIGGPADGTWHQVMGPQMLIAVSPGEMSFSSLYGDSSKPPTTIQKDHVYILYQMQIDDLEFLWWAQGQMSPKELVSALLNGYRNNDRTE